MKPRIQKIGCLLGVWLLTVGMFTTSLAAQETTPAKESSGESTTPRTGPRFKAGEKVEAKHSGVWWYPGTIVSNQGGGKFMVRWDQTGYRNEIIHQDNIRKPGEAQDTGSRFGGSGQAGGPASNTPQRVFTAQDFVVGEKLTWRSQGDTLTGVVARVVSPRILFAKSDIDDKETAVTFESITSKPAAAATAQTTSSTTTRGSRPGSQQTGSKTYDTLYIQGQNILYKNGTVELTGVVFCDRGDVVVLRDASRGSYFKIKRTDIVTPAGPHVVDPVLVKPDMTNSVDIESRKFRFARQGVQSWGRSSATFVPSPITLDVIPPGGVIKVNNLSVGETSKTGFQPFFISPSKPIGTLVYPARENKPAQAITYNLTTAAQTVIYTFPRAKTVLDISPDAQRALTEADGFLSVWSLDGKTATLIAKLEPFGSGTRFNPEVDSATLFPDNGLMVSIDNGKLIVSWQVTVGAAQVLWEFPPYSPVKLTFTPQRTAVMVYGASTAQLLQPQTGEEFWDVGLRGFADNASFSPSGRFFSTSSKSGTFAIYDVRGKTLVKHIILPKGIQWHHNEAFIVNWVNDDFVVVNNQYLVSVATGAPIWEFIDKLPFQATAQGICWALKPGTGSEGKIVASQVITDRITLSEQAITLDAISLFKPGDPVSIKIQIEGGPDGLADTVRRNAEGHFAANKNPIVDNADLQLVCIATVGPVKEITVKADSPNTPDQKLTWRSNKGSIELRKGSQVLWVSGTAYNGPRGQWYESQENESAQESINRVHNETYVLLAMNFFPVRVLKTIDQLYLTKSQMFPQ